MKYIVLLVFTLFYLNNCSLDVVNSDENNKQVRLLTSDEQSVVQASQSFGFDLFKRVLQQDPDNNVFISPLSVSMALGMTLNGANGETYEAMRSTLGFANMENKQINEAYQGLIELLGTVDEKVLFEIANSIWYEKTFSVQQDFLQTNRDYFNAEISALDFKDPYSATIINSWVSDKTHEKIKKVLDQLPAETVMALINAIYFKGTWRYEFDPEETKDDFFITNEQVACKMMEIAGEFSYYHDEEVQIIDLPYGSGNFSMMLMLPAVDVSVNEFVADLDMAKWTNYLSVLQADSGTLQMPKFRLKYKSETEAAKLNDILTDMGMGIAFSPGGANFSRINPDQQLFISQVLHKTFVQVDEEGTEAAAVTVVLIDLTSIGGDSKFFMRLDRPFVFVIHERNTSAILFLGKLLRPEWQE